MDAEHQVTRRLAAIFAADVVGYSALTEADEAGTLAALKQVWSEVFNPAVARHQGRIVKMMGDGALVEFASVVGAVECAIAFQRAMAERKGDGNLAFRVGINLGEIVIEGDDILGDGVNVAARLESQATPGGILVSEMVHAQVSGKVGVTFADGGEIKLKNIERPLRVWRWDGSQPAPAMGGEQNSSVPPAGPGVMPSLAVLPFHNMNGDPQQEYFADGVVEDIITALSRFRYFAVIARNSSFAYKNRTVDVRQVSRELGVRYVLEGSVRRAGSRLRISTQLVDGATGVHLWAHNFDGAAEDVFDVQDRITESVVALVAPKIQRAEIDRSRRKRPESLDAYDLYLQALPEMYASRPEANVRAIELLERSVALDPGFALAMARAAHAYVLRVCMQFPGASSADAERALALARGALAIARDDAQVLSICAVALIQVGKNYDVGIALLRRAIAENPNNGVVLANAGIGALLAGDLGEATDYLQRALRLNPNEIGTHWQLSGIAHIRMAEGHYEEALDWATRSQAINPGYDATHWMLIAANAHLGRMDEARKHLAGLEAISPGISLERIRRGQHAIDPHRIDVLIEGMRLAGMRES